MMVAGTHRARASASEMGAIAENHTSMTSLSEMQPPVSPNSGGDNGGGAGGALGTTAAASAQLLPAWSVRAMSRSGQQP